MATTFDYNGPPVNVTNGMAMKVVNSHLYLSKQDQF